jgi:hypothetical protein
MNHVCTSAPASRGLHELAAAHVAQLSVIVDDDAMAPTLLPGDVVMLDTGERQARVCGLYAIRINGRTVVRRLQTMVMGGLTLIHDNPAYGREFVPMDAVEDLEIVGRVASEGLLEGLPALPMPRRPVPERF